MPATIPFSLLTHLSIPGNIWSRKWVLWIFLLFSNSVAYTYIFWFIIIICVCAHMCACPHAYGHTCRSPENNMESVLSLHVHDFQKLNSGYQAYTAKALVIWVILLTLYLYISLNTQKYVLPLVELKTFRCLCWWRQWLTVLVTKSSKKHGIEKRPRTWSCLTP